MVNRKEAKTNNELYNITQKTDATTRTPLNIGVTSCAPER